jgi:hypothetical protein
MAHKSIEGHHKTVYLNKEKGGHHGRPFFFSYVLGF